MLKLREYQERIVSDGLSILKTKNLVYLACQTRTGKTFMALSIAHRYGAVSVLFLTKRKAISSISDDFKSSGYRFRFTVASVDSAHKVTEKHDLIIIDEAHVLGAFPKPSGRTKKVRALVKKTPVIFLSATPTPESWSQIYHQLYVSAYSPFGYFKNFYRWADEYVTVEQKQFAGVHIADYSKADAEGIQAVVSPFMLTLTQSDAGFRQEVDEHVLSVTMHPAIRTLMKKLVKERYHQLKDGGEIICDTAASLMQKCHQLSGGTVICADGVARTLDRSKAEAIARHFSGRKIAVFYKFVAEFALLKEAFPNWTDSPDVFRAQKNTVFLGQFISAREGLELSVAECMVFYTTDYPWLSYWQSRERIQNISRETRPELWFVRGDTGMEERIFKRVKQKKTFTATWFMKDYCKRIMKDDRAGDPVEDNAVSEVKEYLCNKDNRGKQGGNAGHYRRTSRVG